MKPQNPTSADPVLGFVTLAALGAFMVGGYCAQHPGLWVHYALFWIGERIPPLAFLAESNANRAIAAGLLALLPFIFAAVFIGEAIKRHQRLCKAREIARQNIEAARLVEEEERRAHALQGTAALVNAMREKTSRNPPTWVMWASVCFFVAGLGCVLYVVFGN